MDRSVAPMTPARSMFASELSGSRTQTEFPIESHSALRQIRRISSSLISSFGKEKKR